MRIRAKCLPGLFLLLAACEPPGESGETASAPADAASAVERRVEGPLVFENVPPVPDSLTERLQRFQNTRSAAFEDWHPDGGMLISTRFGQVAQIHRVAEPMAMRRQLTFFDEPVTNADYAPAESGHNGFLFTKDVGGNEQYQIYYFDDTAGEIRLLTPGEARSESPVWTRAGDRFAYRSNARNGTDWDLYLASPAGGEPEMIFEGEGFWLPGDFGPDDRRLAVIKYVSITDTTLGVLDLESGEMEEIRTGEQPAFYAPVEFAADGEGLYLLSDAGSEFRTLRHYDFEAGEMTELTGDLGWNVENADLSPDGKLMAFSVNEDGLSKLHIRTTEGWRRRPAPDLPAGILGGLAFSPDGTKLAFTLELATGPADVYVYDLAAQALTRWTESEVGGLDTDRFIAPELVRYQSFDGRDIPAFVYKPREPGPHPVVIQIHGGPEGQYRPDYSAYEQYWASEMGVAVIAPNVRGSSGYGKSYVSLDNGRKREDSVKDIGALLDWIAEQPDLDESRVVVFGGSYGGYMVLASMVHYSDRLMGGIDIVGISNFVTFLENTRDYRKAVRRPEYGDERDSEMRDFLESISPANHAEEITKPLLVIQGKNDPRVPVTESEQMVREIREAGGEVWYLMAENEGHGFSKKSNRDTQMAVIMMFLEHLLGGG